MNEELKKYDELGNWDFTDINCFTEFETNWNMGDEIKKYSDEKSLILDIGTGGGEKALSQIPHNVGMIIGTDLSENMIKTAKKNLQKNKDVRGKFVVMDNLKIEFPDGLFDIVTARHTVINAKEIYRVLNDSGVLILRGVDKYDCWEIKEVFGRGQSFDDEVPISDIDYRDIKEAGFKNIELIKIHGNEYFKTKEDLLKLLLKTPIINDFSITTKDKNIIEEELLDKYVEKYTTEKGIVLKRKYYGIVAKK